MATGQAATIVVRVRLFAMQREMARARELSLELPVGATVEDAWAALVVRVPSLAPGRQAVRFAVDRTYVGADTILADGAELACIPPVSGGAGGQLALVASGPPILGLLDEPFPIDLAARLAARLTTPEDGAVVTFLGVTRQTPGRPAPGEESAAAAHQGEPVQSLAYEAHEPMVMEVLGAIAAETAARFGVGRLAIVHRTGVVPLGEPSVLVVAVAGHRDAAFAAARYAIDETKARAPIWKAERYRDGQVWTGEPARGAPDEEAR